MSPLIVSVGGFLLGMLSNLVLRSKGNEISSVPQARRLLRDYSSAGIVSANFMVHDFHRLDIAPLQQIMVNGFEECGMRCVAVPSCFSVNVAAFVDIKENTLCELLAADKYNESSKFLSSEKFHHLSILSPCYSNPCDIGATCDDNSFACACADGHLGRNCEVKGFPFHWKLDGKDKHINFRGASKFDLQCGQRVLFLNGSPGTFAETPAVPIHSTDFTIGLWIRLIDFSYQQPIFGDWSSPFSFRLFVKQNGSWCFQARDRSGVDLYDNCTDSKDFVTGKRWSHVAVTWNRSYKRVRLFTNGEIKVESYLASNGPIDIMNSGHSFYDIGLKRDSGTVAHAYFSDLIIFDREYSFSQSVNEIKDNIFSKHPLHDFI
ncbi:uncharacterized protein [Acropora muricata]|uniref:uncharacterized protein n=1 Tax=Acropora muricata TaxID=159855 RepID=UPI0034E4BEDE